MTNEQMSRIGRLLASARRGQSAVWLLLLSMACPNAPGADDVPLQKSGGETSQSNEASEPADNQSSSISHEVAAALSDAAKTAQSASLRFVRFSDRQDEYREKARQSLAVFAKHEDSIAACDDFQQVAQWRGGQARCLAILDKNEALNIAGTASDAFRRAKQTRDAGLLFDDLGDVFYELEDYVSSVQAFRKAMKLLKSCGAKEDLASSTYRLAHSLRRLSSYEDAADQFRRAVARYDLVDDKLNAARAQGWTGDCHYKREDYEAAATAYADAVTRFNELKRDKDVAINSNSQAHALYHLGRFAEAAPHYEAAARAYDASDNPVNAAWMYGWKGDSHRKLEDDAAAANAYAKAVERFKAQKHDAGLALNGLNLGKSLYRMEKFPEALAHFEAAARAYEAMGDAVNAAWLEDWKGDCHRELGNEEAAASAYQEAVARFTKLQHHGGVAANSSNLAKSLFRRRKFSEAVPHFEAAARAYEASDNAVNVAWMHGWKGDALHNHGRYENAAASYREAIRRFESLKHDNGKAINLGNLGESLTQLAQYDAALAAYESALPIRRRQANGDSENVARSLNSIGAVLSHMGRWQDAVEKYESSIAMYERLEVGPHATLARARDNLGLAYRRLAKYDEALREVRAAQDMLGQLYSGDEPLVADNLNSLGICLASLARYEDSLNAHRASLAMRRRLYPDDHPAIAVSLENIGWTLDYLGRYEQALVQHRAALALRKRVFGDRCPTVARSWNGVGSALAGLDRLEDALEAYETSLAINRALFSGDHSEVATGLNSVGCALNRLDRYGEALERHREALAMRQRVFPGDHSDTALSLSNIATSLRHLGRYREALDHALAALEMSERLRGMDHPSVAGRLIGVAHCYGYLGNYEEALRCYERTLSIRRETLGGGHPDVAIALGAVGNCLNDLGRHWLALQWNEESARILSQLYPAGHSDLAHALSRIGNTYKHLGDRAKEFHYHQQSLDMLRRCASEGPLNIAAARVRVAHVLSDNRQFDEAMREYEAAIEDYKRLKGPQHPIVATIMEAMAVALTKSGKKEEALEMMQDVVSMVKAAYGRDHPDVAHSVSNLGVSLQWVGRHADALEHQREAVAISERVGDPDLYRRYAKLGRLYLKRLEQPALAADAFEKAIECFEQLRLRVGGDDLDRLQFFDYVEGSYDLYEDIVQAHLALNRTERAVAYLERGRTRTLLDILERGNRLGGRDLLDEVVQRAAAAGNGPLARKAEAVRKRLDEAQSEIARLQAEINRHRSNDGLDFAERKAILAPLQEKLKAAQQRHRQAHRAKFNLVGDDAVSDLKPLSAQRLQAALAPRQRMLLYSVGDDQSVLLLVRPSGEAIEAFRLTWPEELVENVPEQGVYVRGVVPDSPAERMGIVAGDVILSYDGETYSPEELAARTTKEEKAKGTVEVVVWQSGHERRFTMPRGKMGAYIGQLSPTKNWTDVTESNLRHAVGHFIRAIQHEGRQARGLARASSESTGRPGVWGALLFRAVVPEGVWAELKSCDLAYVAADGALNRLPLEALFVARGDAESAPRFWLDQGPPISYGPSGTVIVNRKAARDDQLSRFSKGQQPRKLALLLGDPRFHRSAGGPKPPEKGCTVLAVDGAGSHGGRLAPGDVIVEYDGRAVDDDKALKSRIRAVADAIEDGDRPHAPVDLSVWRQGERFTLRATPGPLGVEIARAPPREALESLQTADATKLASVTRGDLVDRYGRLTRLFGSRREVLRIYETLAGAPFGAAAARSSEDVSVLLDADATRTRLFSEAAGARYVHLATHGLVDETEGVSWSSLALAEPAVPTPADFGFLTLQDLFDRWWGRLNDTELVVLSACDSQRGRATGGDGVFGMPWGFMYAGAPAVIASLWQVDDQATAELFGDFYAEIGGVSTRDTQAAGVAKLAAFTRVRKALRAKRPEPYFWAPFVYQGDPR